MYWLFLKLFILSIAPIPINPKLSRPDPVKNSWVFECDGFTSGYQIAKAKYLELDLGRNPVPKSSEAHQE
jgi:hypothetical protein